MATLAKLCEGLDRSQLNHLQRLVRTWATLADISFADLLLCRPDQEADEAGYTVVAQVRPTTGRSIYRTDVVGATFEPGQRPLLDLARITGEIIDGGMIFQDVAPRLRTLSVPVRHKGKVIALLSREFSPDEQRDPGELEMNYFFTFRRLARMIAEGSYPFPVDEVEVEEAPRVSDGLLILDESARVQFASPNAVSVLTRLGVRQVEGQRLSAAGADQRAVRLAFSTRLPQTEEIVQGDQTAVIRAIPVIEGDTITGAVVLMRDISELRRRDRLLLSKDATIAEIHHRVKNNLQTISSLLRLQSRRLVADEARQAIDESVRRIRSIAVVHEILSQELSSDVPFSEIIRPLVRVVEESFSQPDQPIHFRVEGDAGELPTDVATSLAVVVSELMQNAVQHGFAGTAGEAGSGRGSGPKSALVLIQLAAGPTELRVSVTDNGVGPAAGFDLDDDAGLGLTIVRTLVENDLGGSIEVRPATDGSGTTVRLSIPLVDDWDDGDDLSALVKR